jgi:hypothetical protein
LPPPIYTSPIGQATTVTVQAFPLSEAIISVVDAHSTIAISKGPQTVNSLTTDYNEPMDIPLPRGQSKEDIRTEIGKAIGGTAPMDLDMEQQHIIKANSESATTAYVPDGTLINNINLENLALFVDM